jgi:hypothetical protein
MQPGQPDTRTSPACDLKDPCEGRQCKSSAQALSPMGDSKAKLSCLGTPRSFGIQRPVSHMLPEAMVLFVNKFRRIYDRKVKHTLIKEHPQNIAPQENTTTPKMDQNIKPHLPHTRHTSRPHPQNPREFIAEEKGHHLVGAMTTTNSSSSPQKNGKGPRGVLPETPKETPTKRTKKNTNQRGFLPYIIIGAFLSALVILSGIITPMNYTNDNTETRSKNTVADTHENVGFGRYQNAGVHQNRECGTTKGESDQPSKPQTPQSTHRNVLSTAVSFPMDRLYAHTVTPQPHRITEPRRDRVYYYKHLTTPKKETKKRHSTKIIYTIIILQYLYQNMTKNKARKKRKGAQAHRKQKIKLFINLVLIYLTLNHNTSTPINHPLQPATTYKRKIFRKREISIYKRMLEFKNRLTSQISRENASLLIKKIQNSANYRQYINTTVISSVIVTLLQPRQISLQKLIIIAGISSTTVYMQQNIHEA